MTLPFLVDCLRASKKQRDSFFSLLQNVDVNYNLIIPNCNMFDASYYQNEFRSTPAYTIYSKSKVIRYKHYKTHDGR